MKFTKKDYQYRSVKTEGERAAKWAELFGFEVDYEGAGTEHSSMYYSLYFEKDDECESFSLRVSRHEPNYAMRGDEDIMLYVAGPLAGSDDTDSWLWYAERLHEISGNEFPSAINSFFSRRENSRRKKQEVAAKYEELRKIKMAEAQEKYKEVLHQRCHQHGIDEDKIRLAYEGFGREDVTGIYTQLRKWFAGMTLNEALGFAKKGFYHGIQKYIA